MSSGKGGSGKRTVHMGTIAGVLGAGPAYSLVKVISNAKEIWSGPVLRSASANPYVLNLPGYGPGRLYWGTEDQTADVKLARYAEQPAYRGSVYFVLDDCRFGSNGETNPPNLEFIWRRNPDQDIVSTVALDAAFVAPITAAAAELLRSWDWLGLPTDALDGDSFVALAAALAGDPRNAVAPLNTDQVSMRAALADLALIADAWFRIGVDGRIQAGHWPRGGPAGAVTELGYADLTESPEIEVADDSALPNAISVEYTDAAKLHKANATLVKDDAAIRTSGGRVRKQTARRPMLLTVDAAQRHGADLLAVESAPAITVTLTVFRSLAVRPDGEELRPGDYFVFPVQLLPELPAAPRLFRLVRREYGITGPVTLTGELDRSAAAVDTVAADVVSEIPAVLPPMNWVRIFALPEAELAIYAVAARPADSVIGYDVRYDDDEDGDFPAVGNQPGCALPLLVQAFCSAVAETISVRLLSVTAGGANPRRDEHLLRNWSGGLMEARDDRLLLIVLKRDGADIERAGGVDYIEVMSVAGPATITETDTFSVPVLRGRRGTSARSFDGGDWEDYEAWLVPSSTLRAQDHADWIPAAQAGNTLWFRFRPYAQGAEYHGETAYAERQRRTAAAEDLQEFAIQEDETDTPTVPYQIPEAYLVVGDATYSELYDPIVLIPPSASVSASCRKRDGTGTVKGFEEYRDPSTPPKKFLQIAFSGTADNHGSDNASCGPESCVGAGVIYGGRVYNPDTDAITDTGYHDTSGTCGTVHEPITAVFYNPDLGDSLVTSRLSRAVTCDLACHPVAGGGSHWRNAVPTYREDLLVEDTDAAAKLRLTAAFAAWETIAWGSCAGISSIWEVRSAGFSFVYREAQLRFEGVGYFGLWSFVLRIVFEQRLMTGSTWEDAETQVHDVPTDASGLFDYIVDVPIAEGYETRVKSYTISIE